MVSTSTKVSIWLNNHVTNFTTGTNDTVDKLTIGDKSTTNTGT